MHCIQGTHYGYPQWRCRTSHSKGDLHVEDLETTDRDNNDRISASDAAVALGVLVAEENTDKLLPSNQARLTALMREINDLHQWVEAREGKLAESLDHIE